MNCSNSSFPCNETTEFDGGYPILVVQAIVMCLCLLLGLVGNGAIVFVVAARRQLQTVANLYILNLAISNIICLVSTPVSVNVIATKDFNVGHAVCIFESSSVQVGILTNSIFLTFISIDCYIGTRQGHHTPNTRWKMLKVVTAVAWVAGAVFVILVFFTTTTEEYCVQGPMFKYDIILKPLCIFVIIVVPLIMVWVYVGLCFSPKLVGSNSLGEETLGVMESRQILFGLAVAFTVTQGTYWLYQLVTLIHSVRYVGYILASFIDINMTVNPILIIIYNWGIRRELSLALPSRIGRMMPMETL